MRCLCLRLCAACVLRETKAKEKRGGCNVCSRPSASACAIHPHAGCTCTSVQYVPAVRSTGYSNSNPGRARWLLC